MNLVGELITDRNRLAQLRDGCAGQAQGSDWMEHLAQVSVHLGRITDQLQEEVMRIRMLPIENVFNKYPRPVRDLARRVSKEVELVIRGADTELDRTVVEEISDPLLHLLRNAVDHGLETPAERVAAGKAPHGTLLLAARHQEGRIVVTVEDDGRGIDVESLKAGAVRKGVITAAEAAALPREEALHLIYQPGLSTARSVTDISGRGVGMDIVRANLERLNGTITVETWPGRGTRFEIGLPLTLAIVSALLVRVGREAGAPPVTFAIPLNSVTEAARVAGRDVHWVNQRPVVRHRAQVLPLMHLSDLFRPEAAWKPAVSADYALVALRWGKLQLGVVVDALLGEQDVVVKPLGPLAGEGSGVAGTVILGDGQVALVADVPGLFKLAGGKAKA
jgi:two-component system chemotaxis sensor kinase CheA